MEAFWGVLLISAFVCAGLCERVASSKGLQAGGWCAAGLLLGPLALIAVAGMPDKKLRRTLMAIANHQGVTITKEDAEEKTSENIDCDFTTTYFAADDEIWANAVSALGDDLGRHANRLNSQISIDSITIEDQFGTIIARASYAGDTTGYKKWKFRYKKE